MRHTLEMNIQEQRRSFDTPQATPGSSSPKDWCRCTVKNNSVSDQCTAFWQVVPRNCTVLENLLPRPVWRSNGTHFIAVQWRRIRSMFRGVLQALPLPRPVVRVGPAGRRSKSNPRTVSAVSTPLCFLGHASWDVGCHGSIRESLCRSLFQPRCHLPRRISSSPRPQLVRPAAMTNTNSSNRYKALLHR